MEQHQIQAKTASNQQTMQNKIRSNTKLNLKSSQTQTLNKATSNQSRVNLKSTSKSILKQEQEQGNSKIKTKETAKQKQEQKTKPNVKAKQMKIKHIYINQLQPQYKIEPKCNTKQYQVQRTQSATSTKRTPNLRQTKIKAKERQTKNIITTQVATQPMKRKTRSIPKHTQNQIT